MNCISKQKTVSSLVKTAENRICILPNNPDFCSNDYFCSGLVIKITQTTRRVQKIPFSMCIISHTGLLLETTRKKTYYVEYCEQLPIMVHDVTDEWNKRRKNYWNYSNFKWAYFKTYQVPIVSYNVQFVAQIYLSISVQRGNYNLTGNNCHFVAESVLNYLKITNKENMYYGTSIQDQEAIYNPQVDMLPIFYL